MASAVAASTNSASSHHGVGAEPAAAIAEAQVLLRDGSPEPLCTEELAMYRQDGFVVVRGLVPELMADVIRERIIQPGLKMERGLDVADPTTWGKGALARHPLSLLEKIVTLLGSESPYYGARMGFGRALQREHRADLSDAEFGLLEEAWALANKLAARRLLVVLDQLVGLPECRFDPEAEPLGRGLHARYALPAKDPGCAERHRSRWPLFGWHVDGAWHVHFLGKKVEVQGERREKPAHACVGMIAWNRTLPHGGMTGVIRGSHRRVMRLLVSAARMGGVSNLCLLVWLSLFGGAASDPVASALGEKEMRAGDMLIMHPYLVHSSSWNYQSALRLGGHVPFEYRKPMSEAQLVDMVGSQARRAQSGQALPVNTELLLEVVGGAQSGPPS